ncbi:MAG: ELM1/GtrOC1 family putative glycosyltransferase [Candidatus Omnitrophica bacterium]|nr:ELM1/GtrOC1 family putative glycosyltransferase [Candidatus Omnitrophota bacterium]
MKQNSTADYLACILFRAAGLFTSFLPFNVSLFMGRRLGELIYLFDRKHRAIACANIRKAVVEDGDYKAARRITRRAYQAFGQNLIEISFIPRINKEYLEKYINIENLDYVDAAFKRGKGVIFLAVHEGDWELSNIICANVGVPFVLFVRDQGFPRLNALLNSYRLKQGAKIIYKQAGPRQLVETVNKNQAIGMTMDQGGKTGELVKFFGKEASMSTGAVKLALKYDCSIIPTFYTRVKGPYIKVILDQVYTVSRSGEDQKDLRENLQRLAGIYEKYIRLYPHEYLWTYKIWKYGRERELLILSDGKTGHLRQSESAAKLIIQQLSGRGIRTNLSIQEVKSRESRQSLMKLKPDIIISAGSSVSGLNYRLARQNLAKSIVLMRPANISLKKFDLVIMPEHDWPPGRGLVPRNVVVTSGALNLIDADLLKEKSGRLKQSGFIKGDLSSLCIGVLVGGDSKGFSISGALISGVISRIKKAAEELNADILLTTSRRTSAEAEQVIKNELGGYSRCKLLVIANENNHPDVVGGILGLSSIIITSPESISMVSEAASAGKYVAVFKAPGLSRRHRRFLSNYHDKGYIYLTEAGSLADSIKEIWKNRPQVCLPQNNLKVAEALSKIL